MRRKRPKVQYAAGRWVNGASPPLAVCGGLRGHFPADADGQRRRWRSGSHAASSSPAPGARRSVPLQRLERGQAAGFAGRPPTSPAPAPAAAPRRARLSAAQPVHAAISASRRSPACTSAASATSASAAISISRGVRHPRRANAEPPDDRAQGIELRHELPPADPLIVPDRHCSGSAAGARSVAATTSAQLLRVACQAAAGRSGSPRHCDTRPCRASPSIPLPCAIRISTVSAWSPR